MVESKVHKQRSGVSFFLSRFLLKAPALEHLRLNFQTYRIDGIEDFLCWLAEIPSAGDGIASGMDDYKAIDVSVPRQRNTNGIVKNKLTYPQVDENPASNVSSTTELPKSTSYRYWHGNCYRHDTTFLIRQV